MITFALLAATLIVSSCKVDPPSILDPQPPRGNETTDPDVVLSQAYRPGTERTAIYRIPAMVITKNDVVLVFAEARVDGESDAGNINIVLKRSLDKGKTWQPSIMIHDTDGIFDGPTTAGNRSRNPSPVYLPDVGEKGRVVLVWCYNPGHTGNISIFTAYSDDEGVTWSVPKDISESIYPSQWRWYATGPVHGIVMQRNSRFNGRVVVPCNHNMRGDEDNNAAHVIYSDDNGMSWHVGGSMSHTTGNESTVVELSDGRLMLNSRNSGDSRIANRQVAISTDGGETWGSITHDPTLTDPICQASIFYYDNKGDNGKGRLLFSNPGYTEAVSRRHGKLRLSNDDGMTWPKYLLFTYANHIAGDAVGYCSYTDIAKFSDGTIALAYETGYKYAAGIYFRTVSIDKINTNN